MKQFLKEVTEPAKGKRRIKEIRQGPGEKENNAFYMDGQVRFGKKRVFLSCKKWGGNEGMLQPSRWLRMQGKLKETKLLNDILLLWWLLFKSYLAFLAI